LIRAVGSELRFSGRLPDAANQRTEELARLDKSDVRRSSKGRTVGDYHQTASYNALRYDYHP
jgi:hypothetical protein